MRKKVWLGRAAAIACAAGVGVLAAARIAHAWEAPYVKQAIEAGIAAAKAAKDVSGYSPRSDGWCLIGGWIEKGKELTFRAKLKEGTEYLFIGSGDSDTKDLDLEAVEGGKVICADEDEDATPVVAISAEGDADVTLKLKLDNAKADHVFAVLIMLESTKVKAKLDTLEHAAKQLTDAVGLIADSAELEFDQAPNVISLAGCLLDPDASKEIERGFSRKAEYVIVGAADDACKDLDMVVSKDGDTVEDEEEDATPVVHFKVADHGKAKIKLTAHDASKRTFAVCAILTKKK